MLPLRPFVLAFGLSMTSGANAHEFWISPEAYLVKPGDQVQAHLRVGQEFKGGSYSFNPRNFTRFDVVTADTLSPAPGRIGDTPALNMKAPEEGLLVIAHETSDFYLTYTEWAKFEKFARHKDFVPLLEDHESRGLPKDRFVEQYSRHAKSLISIGNGQGADKELGLRTEIVALANPYTDELGVLPVKVLLDGKPRADVQVELFDKAPDGTVEISLYRTNADGIGEVPIKPGHEYLVDSVTVLPLEAEDTKVDAVWLSMWASLTFKVPEK